MPWFKYHMDGLVYGDDPDKCLDTLNRVMSSTMNGLVVPKHTSVGDVVEVEG